MIDHRRKVVFVHIPRTSGSSIEEAFGLAKEARLIHHYTASMLRPMVGDDYYWFSIVRNPWDRIVSAYHQPGNKKVGYASGASLEEFLNNWSGSSASHEYSTTQNGYLNIDGIEIFKFEQRHQAIQKLKHKYGVDIGKFHIRKTKARKPYREYYNKKTKAIVTHRWAEDIHRFGYTF